MRPTPTLSGAWTYFVTLTDLRTDFEANGMDRAEVEVFDSEAYAPYGVLRAAYGALRKVPYEEQSVGGVGGVGLRHERGTAEPGLLAGLDGQARDAGAWLRTQCDAGSLYALAFLPRCDMAVTFRSRHQRHDDQRRERHHSTDAARDDS